MAYTSTEEQRIKAFVFSNFDTLMYSALNHLSIKAIKHRFSAAHLNCAVFVADDRCSSMMIKPDAQAHAQAMRSTRQGCPSPAQYGLAHQSSPASQRQRLVLRDT